MSDLLSDRRIVVTGGASGMGEALVRALPGLGARVVSLDLAVDAGTAIAEEAGASFVECDVSSEQSVEVAFKSAAADLGGLDVLIHAAGVIPDTRGPAENGTLDTWNRVMTINATGTFLTNRAAFVLMKDSGGRILNFASNAGVEGLPQRADYSASKGAVVAWTRTVAREWAQYSITVNAIAPAIWTPMYDRTRAGMSPEQLAAHDVQLAKEIPLGGRNGDPQRDFVPVLAFLASDGSRFMTGQVFPIDGGMMMMR